MTFDEVLQKHFIDFDNGLYVRNTAIGTFLYADLEDDTPEEDEIDGVIIYAKVPKTTYEWLPVQSFQSPEKLDQFLILLFEG